MTFPIIPASTVNGAYRISNSLRFRSSASAYLSRTPASAGNRKTWTWSGWVKRGYVGSSAPVLFNAYSGNNDRSDILFNSDSFDFFLLVSSVYVCRLTTTPVYRDPSAWYHFIVAFDSTQATASDRIKMYVNGVQVTAFSTASYPSLNYSSGYINSANIHLLGAEYFSSAATSYFDGYMAEVNFIDGQALTPSSFGAYDTNGVWQPAKYTGSYGTNGFYLPFTLNNTSTYAGTFTGSNYLSAGTQTALQLTSSTAFTLEGWVNFDAVSAQQYVFSNWVAGGAGYAFATGVAGYAANIIAFYDGATWRPLTQTVSANTWYHFAISSSGSASGTYCYINGISQTSGFSTNSAINNTTSAFYLGSYTNSTTAALTGKLSNFRLLKGTNLYPNGTSFVPSSSPLTAITNTQLLALQSSSVTTDNSSNAFTITNTGSVSSATVTPFVANITSDASGNNNTWTGNNINYSSSGTTYDSMIDSPTNYADGGNGRGNYAVLNPVTGGSSTTSDGNLSATLAPVNGARVSTIAVTSGKWYCEMVPTTIAGYFVVGIGASYSKGWDVSQETNPNNIVWSTSGAGVYIQAKGSWTFSSNTVAAYYTTNDVIGIALDLDNNTLAFYKNGLSQGSMTINTQGMPVAFLMGNSSGSSNGAGIANFGQRPFTYSNYGVDRPASTYLALNTQNLPTPTIAAGNKYFDATTYTGNGTTQSITNSGSFQPDFVWLKGRSFGSNNFLADAIRGAANLIFSDTTNAETYVSNGVTSFNSNGFSVGTHVYANQNGSTFIGWQWKANGTGVSNTSGSITSTVSANTSAGFSVVTWTVATANSTVGHGLGVAPSLIIAKGRSNAGGWPVYHTSLGGPANFLLLNTTASTGTDATSWMGNTAPTSSVFSVANAINWWGPSGSTFVAYCFAAVAGYSAAFSYTGNGSADGPMVYLGFRPRWVMYKRTDTVGSWQIFDTSRNTYNDANTELFPNLSDAEYTGSAASHDILSNGFKLRTTNADRNASGGSYIGYAIAENPFKVSRAR